jgi:hypothetical protein
MAKSRCPAAPRAVFNGAPRALGIDIQGREVLSYLPGDVVGQRGTGAPPQNAAWAYQTGAPRDGGRSATGLALGNAGDSAYGMQWRQIMLPRLERDSAFVHAFRR